MAPATGSINTSFAFTVEELVLDHFIKGSCQNVENITSFGHETSIGYFSNGQDIIGFSTGIIISTGDIQDAAGPNSNNGTTGSFNQTGGDQDLDLFATNIVVDATGIEFDFIPFGDQVEFKYAFASEEYCEFVGSIFNDLFGFFVSGPGINGDFSNNAINVATLGNTGEYVSINTVNHSLNSANYVRNELQEDTDNCGIAFGANYLEEIEYDGFTIPLTATIDVIPCETYHIRLVVGDVGDDKLDSAVFLAAKSFDLGGKVNVVAKSEGSDEPVAYENCRNGEFVFTRGSNLNINQPLEVNFTISPLSEATSNIDYTALPNSITIPANQISVTLPVEILDDGEDEMPELLRLDIQYECDCFPSTRSDLYIADLNPLEGTFEEIFVCPDQEFTIGPNVTGGATPYQFIWNTSATAQLLTETVDEPTHFTVTISDDCGNTALAIAGVGIQQQPTAILSGEAEICEGDTAFLNIDLEGYAPWAITYSIDGIEQPTISNIYNNPFALPVFQAGKYELIAFDDAHCDGEAVGDGQVNSGGVSFDYNLNAPSCPAVNDGSISLTITEGVPPYEVVWDDGTTDILQREGLPAGNYSISITDENNCLVSRTIELAEPTSYQSDCIENLIYVPNAFSPNEDGINDEFSIYLSENNFIQNIKTVKIFSRWGEMIIGVSNITPALSVPVWDGSFKGKKMNTGVFIWVVELELADGTKEILTGDVSLVE